MIKGGNKIMRYILAILVAALPMLWIPDYFFTNPIWWTVVLAWHFGTIYGAISNEFRD